MRKEYLCEKCAWKENCDFCGGENTAFDCCECPADSYEDGFKAGANHVYGLPLSQRLTAEEKERARKIYYDAERGEVNGHYDVYPDPCEVMRVIFGADFFKEGE